MKVPVEGVFTKNPASIQADDVPIKIWVFSRGFGNVPYRQELPWASASGNASTYASVKISKHILNYQVHIKIKIISQNHI